MTNSNRNNYPKNKSTAEASRRSRPFYETPLFWIIIISIILAGGIFAGIKLLSSSSQEKNDISQAEPTDVEKKTSNSNTTEKPEKVSGSTPDSNDESDGKTPVQYDGENPNNSDFLTGNITYAGFSGEKFMIRVSIDQYLTTGTCRLSVSDGNTEYNSSANIFPEASTSSCEGFDIPASALKEMAKDIEITITLSSGDKTGTITGVATL